MEKLDTSTRRDRVESLAHLRVGAGTGKQPSRQRPIVEAGAADENRPASACVDVLDGCQRISRVPRRRVLLGRLDDVDQMMRDAALLLRRHLVGADIEAAVDGGGIAADDLAAAPQRQLDAERALACCGRTQDGENRRAQTLHPEEGEDDDRAEKNQETELLRAGRQRHLRHRMSAGSSL